MKLTKSQLKEMIREELKLNEDDYATQYLDKIDNIKDNVWQRSISIQQMLKKQDKITGTKNADTYNKVLLKHFKKFYLEAKKITDAIKD